MHDEDSESGSGRRDGNVSAEILQVLGLRDGEQGMATLGVTRQSCVRWRSLVLRGLDSVKSLSTAFCWVRQVAAALACLVL